MIGNLFGGSGGDKWYKRAIRALAAAPSADKVCAEENYRLQQLIENPVETPMEFFDSFYESEEWLFKIAHLQENIEEARHVLDVLLRALGDNTVVTILSANSRRVTTTSPWLSGSWYKQDHTQQCDCTEPATESSGSSSS